MISISEHALTELDKLFQHNTKQCLRIYFNPESNNMQLALCLDTPHNGDETEDVCDFTFCYAKDIMEKCGGIHIDTTPVGFAIEPVISLNPK